MICMAEPGKLSVGKSSDAVVSESSVENETCSNSLSKSCVRGSGVVVSGSTFERRGRNIGRAVFSVSPWNIKSVLDRQRLDYRNVLVS